MTDNKLSLLRSRFSPWKKVQSAGGRLTVNRIAGESGSMVIAPLKESPCRDMLKINILNTAESIRSIDAFIEGKGKHVNEITVDYNLKDNARIALNRMIDIVEGREI